MGLFVRRFGVTGQGMNRGFFGASVGCRAVVLVAGQVSSFSSTIMRYATAESNVIH